MSMVKHSITQKLQFETLFGTLEMDKSEILKDFQHCWISRETSLLIRREVLTGKAKFGIGGDGKEVPQVAMARMFKNGDYRAGYYRDQTIHLVLDIASVEDIFAQLYADCDKDPFSGGRQMPAHFATPFLDAEGNWINQTSGINITAGVSATAGQMARALGLAFASNRYRALPHLCEESDRQFSVNGNEICFCTIGDASTSEGVFWETVNAAAVIKAPLAISVWDDGYGISVPVEFQTAKASISAALKGFQTDENGEGIELYVAKGWDYPTMVKMYQLGIEKVRRTHIPAVFHVEDLTQPQGHSTSGSHERYKSKERLKWEQEFDCLHKMEQWLIDQKIAGREECQAIKQKAKKYVKECRDRAWNAYTQPTQKKLKELQEIYKTITTSNPEIEALKNQLKDLVNPYFSEIHQNGLRMSFALMGKKETHQSTLKKWIEGNRKLAHQRYHRHLYSETPHSALLVPAVHPIYSDRSAIKNGYEILNAFFDKAFEKHSNLFAFGEDVGHIGDVNQGFAGIQAKYGQERIFDTGIREWTIVGQALGMAMRGMRPIAEVQYIDYLLYGLAPLSDDIATMRYRTNGIQASPVIIRTRGHRYEGIWHSGSPMGLLINSLRGMWVLTPRNMVQASGMYNTLLQADDPAILVECLNGYRLKEKLPDNIGEYTVPLGVPEFLQQGNDITLVTYGSCVRIVQSGIQLLEKFGISVELIDIQTLLPFDIHHTIVESIKKTNRLLIVDEDLPGGASAFILQQILEVQKGYRYLDSSPVTLTAKEHRPPYGSDGNYFSKPNPEDVFEAVYQIVYEADPGRFEEGI